MGSSDWLNGLGPGGRVHLFTLGRLLPVGWCLPGQPLQLLLPTTRRSSLGLRATQSVYREPLQGDVARIHNCL